jgi:nucleotide-binding universal stress UspA family protein
MKSILLHVHDDSGQQARLQAALDMARLFGGHVTCLQSMPFAAYAGEPFSGAMLTYEAYAEQMRAERQRFEPMLARDDVPWDWVEARGDASLAVAMNSLLADLIVLSPGGGMFDAGATQPMVGEIVLKARAPVLVVPDAQRGVDGTAPVLIAWNGSPEAAAALRASREVIAKSRAAHVLCIEEDADTHLPAREAAAYLSRHGIGVEVHTRTHGGAGVPDTIRGVADEVGAGLVVMGAYGRPRLVEWVLGGVTRTMLRSVERPLLLAH